MNHVILFLSVTLSFSAMADSVKIIATGTTKNQTPCSLRLDYDLDRGTLHSESQEGGIISFGELYKLSSDNLGVLIPKGGSDVAIKESGKFRLNERNAEMRFSYLARVGLIFSTRSLVVKSEKDGSRIASYNVKNEMGRSECLITEVQETVNQ